MFGIYARQKGEHWWTTVFRIAFTLCVFTGVGSWLVACDALLWACSLGAETRVERHRETLAAIDRLERSTGVGQPEKPPYVQEALRYADADTSPVVSVQQDIFAPERLIWRVRHNMN